MDKQQTTPETPDCLRSALNNLLADVSIGDTVAIFNRQDNVAIKKGMYYLEVVSSDSVSFAVSSVMNLWWFYRDNGESYVGDAVCEGLCS